MQSIFPYSDSEAMTGVISCRECDAKWQTLIDSLSDPIDVYAAWIDETQKLNEEDEKEQAQMVGQAKQVRRPAARKPAPKKKRKPAHAFEDDDDEDDFANDADVLYGD
jgi:transcription elongation factor Elf1